VQIAGSTAPGADRKLSCHVRFASGCESRDLLVPHMHPFDLALAADRIGQAIQAFADDAVDPLDPGGGEGLRKLVSNCFGHNYSFSMRGLRILLLCLAASCRRR
jgi:hypothetical protein